MEETEKEKQLYSYIKTLGFFPKSVKEKKHRKTPRPCGEGSLYKVGDKYYGRVTLGFDSDGKQIRKIVIAPTKKACIEKMQALRSSGTIISTPGSKCPTLIEWLNIWLKEYRKNCSVATKQKYNSYIKNIEKQSFAKTKLNLIKPIELQQYINTLNHYEIILRQIGMFKEVFGLAQANGYIDKNIATFLINPLRPDIPKKPKEKAFTHEEEAEFIKAIEKNRYKILYFLCLYAGLRRGEACALRWENIDLDNRSIFIAEAASRSETRGYTVSVTKTINSIRHVPISNCLYNELISKKQDNGFVYSNKGKMLNADVLTMDFAKTMKQLGLNHTLHHLRHTFATRCHEKKIDIKVVQAWMGHSEIDITFNTYTHATKDMLEAASKMLD